MVDELWLLDKSKMQEPDFLKMKRVIMGNEYSDCKHEFEIYKETDIKRFFGMKCGVFIILKCKKCGDVVNRNLML